MFRFAGYVNRQKLSPYTIEGGLWLQDIELRQGYLKQDKTAAQKYKERMNYIANFLPWSIIRLLILQVLVLFLSTYLK
jgi:hypothetical protein